MSQEIHFEKIIDMYTMVETKTKNNQNWTKTVILNIHKGYIEVSQVEEHVSSALMIGDTLECRVVTNDSTILMDAVVYNIKLLSSSMVLKILNVKKIDNLRKHKRYDVTFSATFRKKDDVGEKYVVVNNVSSSGLSIITKDGFRKGDNIELHIKCKGACFVTMDCTVKWVTQSEQNYFCGLSISYMDEKNKAVYKNLIRRLQSKEKREIKKIGNNSIPSNGVSF